MTRRQFLRLSALSAVGLVAGCAVNPVTGRKQLMFVSEAQEIALDQENSPHQFSADYGALQDERLNEYLTRTGGRLAAVSHRPAMPYSFRGVNATYVNAYAFPGGSIAATRGILLSLDNEAELAALLGHELGHVNARHTARQMTKSILTVAAATGVATYAAVEHPEYAEVAGGLGMVGAGALLARYSRDHERQADELGIQYMTGAGYNPEGFVGLMDMLRSMSRSKPSTIELMFATHPMSENRYQTAVERSRSLSRKTTDYPLYRERYMDNTARLRDIRPAIEQMQQGEALMSAKKYPEAENRFQQALRLAPSDYAGLLLMAKCQMAMGRNDAAQRYTQQARSAYPGEPQALQLSGTTNLLLGAYERAAQDFTAYQQTLPGNPDTLFLRGLALEKTGRNQDAAQDYTAYLNAVNQGDAAQHAYQRLVDWGYVTPPAEQSQTGQ